MGEQQSDSSLVLELRLAITAQDFDRLADFYRHGLVLSPSQVWPADQGRSLVLVLGRATLELFDERQAATVDELEVGEPVSGAVRLVLGVPDREAASSRLDADGAKLVHAAVDAPWGDRTVRCPPSGLPGLPWSAPAPKR